MTKQFLLSLLLSLGFASSKGQSLFLDPDADLDSRVRDLIGQLTLEEKANQMLMNTSGIPRLNIPPYDYWNEALHGVGRSGTATVFPQAIGMAATFDQELIFKVANAISDEARAKFNAYQAA